jgi:hypothetical protein
VARERLVLIRLSVKERELIEACAQLEHVAPSTWMRRVTLIECDRVRRQYQRRKRELAAERETDDGEEIEID